MGIHFCRGIIFLPFSPPFHVLNELHPKCRVYPEFVTEHWEGFWQCQKLPGGRCLNSGFIQFQDVSIEGPFTSSLSFLLHFL